MRLDKYLKISRLVKRRTLAKEIADKGRIDINGRTAKSSTDVQVGDQITIHYGDKTVAVEVLQVLENVKKDAAADLYKNLD
ncbi:MAG: RNA-binding S4 domain-containing protein [Lactobacillus sp.]|jgi:ribosomal 50S subunit-recycling heat shock protein|uniref:RQC P-site tRNA stabilizing factor n=1 Tax=Bombilactobacillus bombi TaxID=1303590 RepID=A0A347SPV3_9LACO|nr:RNA-binding S4 domain-containing protein [Bombilactobacillus bombi]MCO6540987.1 RNA-binding S4 domain-containing protein [Lactobacillus sp.]AXX64062.1 RNA-binding S4 domain-containing protein [Bombilactobacillus bombi]MCO6542639.1 RNA-binding S4 domain-containing protein [Lactobacillus sp.]RHW47755.1 RNA-binding S4 domain-containing protein [Bombilactobacillus bombi]RHW51933.1 RNA-binding S4 domain-containing protein [Bombilactobacillus bombi]